MNIKKIEEYEKPEIPKRNELLSIRNILSVVSVGLLTITISCSSNVKVIEKDQYYSDPILKKYPNPFMPTTTVEYIIKNNTEQPDLVKVSVYNVNGKLVKTLFNDYQTSGEYKLEWNGDDDNGEQLDSGIYFYTIEINENPVETKRMLLLK